MLYEPKKYDEHQQRNTQDNAQERINNSEGEPAYLIHPAPNDQETKNRGILPR
jgi:hypothetical protein